MKINTASELDIILTIANSGLFNSEYYLKTNKDVSVTDIDPLVHYVRYGEAENRLPFNGFDLQNLKPFFKDYPNILYGYIIKGEPEDYHKLKSSINNLNDSKTIIFSTNKQYIPYLSVAIASLIKNASQKRYYSLKILHNGLLNENFDSIRGMKENNIDIEAVDISNIVKEIVKRRSINNRISVETYFRFFIPELFPNLKKAVYLDCDLVVMSNIDRLFEIDLNNCGLAGVKDYFFDHPYSKRLLHSLPAEVSSTYINVGVIVLNLEYLRNKNLFKKCIDIALSNQNFVCFDQDIINIVCKDDIQHIETKWNYTWQHYAKDTYKLLNKNDFKDYITYFLNPTILHYSSDVKPWNFNDGHFSKIFWKFAHFSPFYDYLKNNCPYNTETI